MEQNPASPVILTVDDEPPILKALERTFMVESNWVVAGASSASAALDYLANNRVDVIISDERMPDMPGSELLVHVRTRYPAIPRIILTGHADQAAAIRAINDAQVWRFMQKPWNNEELVSVVRGALDHAAREREVDPGDEHGFRTEAMAREAEENRQKLEKAVSALRQLNAEHQNHRQDLLRVILGITAINHPELVTLAKALVEDVKEVAPRIRVPLHQDFLDACLLMGLCSDMQDQVDLILGRIHGLEQAVAIIDDSREAMNATGPRCIKAETLSVHSRLLRIIHDYHKFNLRFPGSGLIQLAKESFRIYDPGLVETYRTWREGLKPSLQT